MSIKKLLSTPSYALRYKLLIAFFVIGGIVVNNFLLSRNIILDNVPVILSMNDLGYSNSIIEEISLKSFKNYSLYNLRIANTKDLSLDEYEFIHIEVFATDSESIGDDLLIDKMKSVKKTEKEWLLNSNNYKNEIDIENEFFKLDESEWNAEIAYSLYDYNNYPDDKYYRNYIFLKKDNRVMTIEFNTSFEISRQRIDVLKTLIDTDIFDN
ncbi:MAG: hypothetical protein MR500_05435 [Erysipelotrichaceae bacterium]|nr:hypothetical protein [Erysipelotrichaceae bacterium]